MKYSFSFYVRLFAIGPVLWLCLFMMGGCLAAEQNPGGNHPLHEIESVTSIDIAYRNVPVQAGEKPFRELKTALQNSRYEANAQAYPGIVSPFTLIFYTNDQKFEAKLQLYSGAIGKEPATSASPPFEYVDHRVDLIVQEETYTYYLPEDYCLSERIIQEYYNQSAREAGAQLMGNVDGFYWSEYYTFNPNGSQGLDNDQGPSRQRVDYLEFVGEVPEVSEVLDSSNYAFVTRYLGRLSRLTSYEYPLLCDAFLIMDCLKGEYEGALVLTAPTSLMTSSYSSTSRSGKTVYWYPCEHAPDFETGKEYLLCLTEEMLYDYGNSINIPPWSPGWYRCARINDGMLYPCYNTEYHPFLNRTLEEIRQYLKNE